MLEIRRRTTVLIFLLLLAITSVAVLSETLSAAKLRQPQTSRSNFSSNETHSPAQDANEVQVTITRYQDGMVVERTVTTVVTAFSPESSSSAAAPDQPAVAGDIVFSQIYASGGNSGSTYQNNFLELYNRTNATINFSGWRIYLASDNGAFNTSISIASSGGIPIGAHGYLLIGFGPASSNGSPVPADFFIPFFSPIPEVPPVNISPSGKVFLTQPGTSIFGSTCPLPNSQIVDFVGYGSTITCFEGTGPTATIANTTAALRKLGGCTDTDNNAGDFRIGSPTPRNSQSPVNNCGNPIDDPDFFVRQHYADFLNRQADDAGLSFWKNQITSCGLDPQCIEVKRINVSAAFFLSIEFQETGFLAYRTYKASFGNLTTPAGAPVPVRFEEFLPDTQLISHGVVVNAPGWELQLESNKVAFFNAFVARPRFTSAYQTSMSPADFVDALFGHAGVTPSANERSAAINEFGSASNTTDQAARARALRRVAENGTLGQQEKNKAFVLMQYYGYLRRNPYDPPEQTLDFTGYNFWLNKLNQFNGNFVDAEMVKAFITSGEYRQRF
jgi:hypothetical protein